MTMTYNQMLMSGTALMVLLVEATAFILCYHAYKEHKPNWYFTLVIPLVILAVGKGLLSSWRAERKLSGDAETDDRLLSLSRELILTVTMGLTLFAVTFAVLYLIR